jgi:hypothetical protein
MGRAKKKRFDCQLQDCDGQQRRRLGHGQPEERGRGERKGAVLQGSPGGKGHSTARLMGSCATKRGACRPRIPRDSHAEHPKTAMSRWNASFLQSFARPHFESHAKEGSVGPVLQLSGLLCSSIEASSGLRNNLNARL